MAVNATKLEPKSGNGNIAKQDASALAQKAHEIGLEETKRQKELRFKATHALLTIFLLWILYVDFKPIRADLTGYMYIVVSRALGFSSSPGVFFLPDLSSTTNPNAPSHHWIFVNIVLDHMLKDAGIQGRLIKQ